MAGEKTEKATPKKRKDERKKGNVFQSKEVVTVFSLIVMFYALKMMAPIIMVTLQNSMKDFIQLGAHQTQLTVADTRVYLIDVIIVFATTTFPLLLISGIVAIVLSGAQTRFIFTMESLKFKGSRINPLEGFKRMFSMRGVVELLKSLIKIIILGVVIYRVLRTELPLFPRMMDMEPQLAIMTTGNIIMSIVKSAAVIFVFVAAFDFGYQWWEYEKNLRMSKQDIKEEYKQQEGDPQIKGKIKERQMQQARRRMMQAVPNADVVIRNPTHFAVAIKYDAEKNSAPVVIAKGADNIALKIVEIAEANGIVVMENKPLARGLYDAVDLDAEIPEQFFRPVAEVLAYVYNLKERERK